MNDSVLIKEAKPFWSSPEICSQASSSIFIKGLIKKLSGMSVDRLDMANERVLKSQSSSSRFMKFFIRLLIDFERSRKLAARIANATARVKLDYSK